MDLPGAAGLLKKGSEISIRSQTSELQFSAMVVYVETKTATSLGLYFHKPYEQNMLAKLLAPVSSSTAP